MALSLAYGLILKDSNSGTALVNSMETMMKHDKLVVLVFMV